MPLLPRAFSIAGLRREQSGCLIDLIYRVVGVATRWMSGLVRGDRVGLLGPLGQPFPIVPGASRAWLVAGGVGLPPLLWWAEHLHQRGIHSVAFVGAAEGDVLPLRLTGTPDQSAGTARPVAAELAAHETPVVVATLDGSVGFRGNVVDAMTRYRRARNAPSADVVVYTCGPEAMMRAVARYCARQDIRCYVCMERSMACGVGTCQSCVVAIRDDAGPRANSGAGAVRYALCCTQGPVFRADRVVWDA